MTKKQQRLSAAAVLSDPDVPIIRAEFICAMLHELGDGEVKHGPGSWNAFRFKSYSDAFAELSRHAHKLSDAFEAKDKARIREHCADVANIAMKIEETFGPYSK